MDKAMNLPTPEERPDLYDDYDGRPEAPDKAETAYWDALAAKAQGDKTPAPEKDSTPT